MRRRALAMALGLAAVGLVLVALPGALRGGAPGAAALAPETPPAMDSPGRPAGIGDLVGGAVASSSGRAPAPVLDATTVVAGEFGPSTGHLVAAGRVVDLRGAPIAHARLYVEREQPTDTEAGSSPWWRRLPSLATRCGSDGRFELRADPDTIALDRSYRDLPAATLRVVTHAFGHRSATTPFSLGAQQILVTLTPTGSVRVRPIVDGELPRGEVRIQLRCADGTLREAFVTLGGRQLFSDVPVGRASLRVFGLGSPTPLRVLNGLDVRRGERCLDVRLDPLVLDGLLQRCPVTVHVGARLALPEDDVRVALADAPLSESPGRWLATETMPGGLELVVPRGSAPHVVFEARGCARSAPLELRAGLVVRLEPSRSLLVHIDAALDPTREYVMELESYATPGWARQRTLSDQGEAHAATFDDVPAGAARARLHEHQFGAIDGGPLLRSGPWVDCVVPEPPVGALGLRLEL